MVPVYLLKQTSTVGINDYDWGWLGNSRQSQLLTPVMWELTVRPVTTLKGNSLAVIWY